MQQDFLLQEHRQIESQNAARQYLKRRERKPLWREYVETALVALIAAVLLRMFVVSAYRVNSGSMEGTLMTGDYIFVNKLAYESGSLPQAGDVIVFKYPNNPDLEYIKRVVAVGGQTVQIADKKLFVDGIMIPDPANARHDDARLIPGDLSQRDNTAPFVVPDGNYYVMGDNRDDSQDSRFWGPVPFENVMGKAVFIYWSWEPATNAPDWDFPYVHHAVLWIGHFVMNFPSSIRWERLITSIPD